MPGRRLFDFPLTIFGPPRRAVHTRIAETCDFSKIPD